MTPTVTITIWAAKPGVVTNHVGSIFLNNTFFSVPPNTSEQWFASSQVPITAESYTIFTHWSHMHQMGDEFQAATDMNFTRPANGTPGSLFYDQATANGENVVEPPLITAAPPGTDQATAAAMHMSTSLPMKMPAGQSISWRCKYTNTSPTQTLIFGDSATQNVMCIYIGQYYPADTTSPSYPDIVSVLNGAPAH
jgi:hypothetical protein